MPANQGSGPDIGRYLPRLRYVRLISSSILPAIWEIDEQVTMALKWTGRMEARDHKDTQQHSS